MALRNGVFDSTPRAASARGRFVGVEASAGERDRSAVQLRKASNRRALSSSFKSLMPSYAAALGVREDRPAAPAALMGIIVSAGYRLTTRTLHTGLGTPSKVENAARAARAAC